jgi:hypothetical protein
VAERVEVLITGDASGLIRTTDQASAAMADFGRSAGKLSSIADALRSDFGRMTGAFAAAQVGVSAVIGAFNQAAAAVQAMNAEVIDAERVASKLIAVFDGAEGAAARLTAQAEALAGSTVFFDDDAIKSAAAALRAFDLTEQEISRLLPAAVNLATVFGTDLDSAAQKLALGLNGSTRGLREFGIVVKEGADRSDVFAQILERGEKAAKGAADAQGGLRGATEGLRKAQGEFNQALGNLLAGPQSALLNFLTDATNRAAGLANSMSGAADQIIKTARVIDPLTGKIVEATGVGGKDLFGPGSLTAQFSGKTTPAANVPGSSGKGVAASRPSGGSSAPGLYQGMGPGMELGAGVNVFKAINAGVLAAEQRAADEREKSAKQVLEDMIAANDAQIVKDQKAAQETIDALADASRKRNEETSKAFDEQAKILEDASKSLSTSLLGAAERAAGLLGKAVSGQSLTAQDFIGLGSMVASAIFPAFAPLIAILNAFMSSATSSMQDSTSETTIEQDKRRLEQLQADFDRRMAGGLIAQGAQEEILQLERQIADKNAMAAQKMVDAAVMQEKNAQATARGGIRDVFERFGSVATKIQKRFADFAVAVGADSVPSYELGILQGMTPEQIAKLGGEARAGIASGKDPREAFANIIKQFPKIAENPVLLNALVAALADLAPDVAGAPGAELGDTPRNPLYVFDVTPSRDEFTRAPRGLFFRPVGSGRGVDGGQSLSGVSSNTTNRAS